MTASTVSAGGGGVRAFLSGGIGVAVGVMLTGILDLAFFFLLGAVFRQIDDSSGIWLPALGFFGVTQLLWLAPAIVLAFVLRFRALALGMIIAASIGFLLNAACWALFGPIVIRLLRDFP